MGHDSARRPTELLGVITSHGPSRDSYLHVIREKCSEALHILDRFHTMAKMNKALDEVRAGESRRMATEGGVPVLKKSRWLLLKREENLETGQRFRLPAGKPSMIGVGR